jgi:hypothetical protein
MRRPRRELVLLALAAGLGGCGSARKFADAPPPPAPLIVAAAITPAGISLSPDHLGAGLVKLVVTNLTGNSQQLTLAASGGGAFQQQTAPINPEDTAQLKAQLGAGRYTVSVKDAAVKAAGLAVGARRPSSQNQLLLP